MGKTTPGMERAQARLQTREVRSYEVAYVNGAYGIWIFIRAHIKS